MEINEKQLKLNLPFRGLIGGPSSSGKTFFIFRLLMLRKELFNDQFTKIIYCYPHQEFSTKKDQEFFQKLELNVPGIEIANELPSVSSLQASQGHTLLILEDMMHELISSASHMKLYTVYSSHCSVSILTTTQNYFEQGKYSKTILRNQTFIVLFDSLSDRQATSMISRQLFPQSKNFLIECFTWLQNNVTSREYRYVFIDCVCTNLPPGFPQVRSHILKENTDFKMIGFTPKSVR